MPPDSTCERGRWFRDRCSFDDDAGEPIVAGTVIPPHIEQVLLPVVVVEERRIETAAIEIDGIGPVAVDVGARDQVVVEIAKRRTGRAGDGRPAVSLHVRVNQVEAAVRVCEIRRPHAA